MTLRSPDLAALHAKVASMEVDLVRTYRASAQLVFARERLRLEQARSAADDSQYEESLTGQFAIAEEVLQLSDELAVIATYRVVELNARRLARWLDKSYVQFSWPTFNTLLRLKARVDLHSLPEAAAANELRLLNNAIKHEGTVTAELAQYPGWGLGSRVHPLPQAFERLSCGVPMFIEALSRAVLPKKLGGNRPDSDVFPPKTGTA